MQQGQLQKSPITETIREFLLEALQQFAVVFSQFRQGIHYVFPRPPETPLRRAFIVDIYSCQKRQSMFRIVPRFTKGRRSQVAKAEVCKTFIQRFDSARRLQKLSRPVI